MKKIKIATDFSQTPGARYISEGDFSGELFRTSMLRAGVQDAIKAGQKLLVDLDGTPGYGSSFLEESFGGLVRYDGISAEVVLAHLDLKSDDEPYLADDIRDYILAAGKARAGEGQ